MVELSWSVLEITKEHLENLVSQGYMTVAELASYYVLVDPVSPAPVVGYAMACLSFYE
jgi:hypothetical protein